MCEVIVILLSVYHILNLIIANLRYFAKKTGGQYNYIHIYISKYDHQSCNTQMSETTCSGFMPYVVVKNTIVDKVYPKSYPVFLVEHPHGSWPKIPMKKPRLV